MFSIFVKFEIFKMLQSIMSGRGPAETRVCKPYVIPGAAKLHEY